jgi:hypothetical protein
MKDIVVGPPTDMVNNFSIAFIVLFINMSIYATGFTTEIQQRIQLHCSLFA